MKCLEAKVVLKGLSQETVQLTDNVALMKVCKVEIKEITIIATTATHRR